MFERIIEEGLFLIRRMEDSPDDYSLLARWLTDDRVLFFYEGRDNPFPIERVRAKYAPRVSAKEGIVACILVYENRPIGYLQFYPADIEEYEFDGRGKIFALDMFIGEPQFWNKGLGTRFLGLLICYLFEQKGADWIILDPHVENWRAIRAYEKAGFRKLKILRQHELHEGKLVDCWLMGIRWDEQN